MTRRTRTAREPRRTAEAGPTPPILLDVRRRLLHRLAHPDSRPEPSTGKEIDVHTTTDVLTAGAGPTGSTAAVELARRGIDCRVVGKRLYADEATLTGVGRLCADVRRQTSGQVDSYLALTPDAPVPSQLDPPVDAPGGGFRAGYGVDGSGLHLNRPDGHLGPRSRPIDADALGTRRRLVFGGAR